MTQSKNVYRELATSEEAKTAHDFFNRMLEQQFSSTFSEAALTSYQSKYDAELFAYRIAAESAVIAGMFDGDDIIGLAIGGIPNGGVASLDWVVVAPPYQGRGIGQELVKACFSSYWSKGAHKVVLYTETEQARHFYERCGMQCEGVHPKHWWGLTHYCMGLCIDDVAEKALRNLS